METKSPSTCPYPATVRRKPPGKARPTTTTTAKSHQIQVRSSSSTVPDVPSFPTEEILSENPKPKSDTTSENLRVFLRIRPLLPSTSATKVQNPKSRDKNVWPRNHLRVFLRTKVQNPKSRAKNVWPQNPAKKNSSRNKIAKKKKSSDVRVKVNDYQSVTLSPPSNLRESKRIKSEVYEGFSHVFAPDSSQEEVYEKMVSPLVEDFLKGKSGMLATLGPSGSGKTHTVFGIPKDPGILPRTLQRIFKPTVEMGSKPRRSFSISIFEIQSERKGEKLFDLSPGGAELTMQKSTIKGLQEVTVSEARQAESLVAHAMLNRLTAMTNSSSQSSRSQCIINIRSVASKFEGEDDYQANNAVLCIVDLAGAEREKKTGNRGARLLESNFINNTSMVFGLCLRSLLEHQKNPKRPLQKHFQNSLLTRYLRDYLEGKKRMALILTVKAGDEDYLDTTYLLRQASPFMRIRFDKVEEQPNIPSNKRQSQALSRSEQPKRMKFWNALKQYKEKLKVAEKEIEHLIENLKLEKRRYVELEKKLGDSNSCITCSQQKSLEITLVKTKTKLDELDFSDFDKSNPDLCPSHIRLSEYDSTPKKCESTPRHGKVISSQSKSDLCLSNIRGSERNSTPKEYDSTLQHGQSNPDLPSECHSTPKEYDSTPREGRQSPLIKFSKRRKVKRWSLIEEKTLRQGVEKYGKGNWMQILNVYRHVFEERTNVDLKDKWRNMEKHKKVLRIS